MRLASKAKPHNVYHKQWSHNYLPCRRGERSSAVADAVRRAPIPSGFESCQGHQMSELVGRVQGVGMGVSLSTPDL